MSQSRLRSLKHPKSVVATFWHSRGELARGVRPNDEAPMLAEPAPFADDWQPVPYPPTPAAMVALKERFEKPTDDFGMSRPQTIMAAPLMPTPMMSAPLGFTARLLTRLPNEVPQQVEVQAPAQAHIMERATSAARGIGGSVLFALLLTFSLMWALALLIPGFGVGFLNIGVSSVITIAAIIRVVAQIAVGVMVNPLLSLIAMTAPLAVFFGFGLAANRRRTPLARGLRGV